MFGNLFQKLVDAQIGAAQARLRRWGVEQDLLGLPDRPPRRGLDSHPRRPND